jgi:penicillin amidase
MWMHHLERDLFSELKPETRVDPDVLLTELRASPRKDDLLETSLGEALKEIEQRLGSDDVNYKWGSLHKAHFNHPLSHREWNLPAIARPGDADTVNATGGIGYQQTYGASYREVIDLADWDRSVTTNTPGESGNPGSKHYGDLEEDWAAGHYHPLPYSRKAVLAAAEERIVLEPAK